MIRRIVLATCAAVSLSFLSASVSADDSCVYSFSKGTFADHISWCVSTSGNIVRFASPQGRDHIGTVGAFTEGVLICRFPGERLAYDTGIDQAGWLGAPTLVDVSPLTIDRTIADPLTSLPILKLRQKFTTDYARKELVVDMTLTNLTSGALPPIALRRLSNLHVGGGLSNMWINSPSGIWSSNRDQGVAVVMASVYRNTSSPDAALTGHAATFDCSGGERLEGPISGDLLGNLTFGMTLGAGKSKTHRVTYRRT